MTTLYEIDKAILDCIDMETGEVIDIDKFDSLEIQREQKLENIALYIRNLKSDVEEFKKEKENFVKKQRVAENKIKSLTSYLDFALNGEKFKTPRVSVSYRKSKKLVIDNELLIPDDYKKIEITIDKRAITNFLNENDYKEIGGCHLEETANIQIK